MLDCNSGEDRIAELLRELQELWRACQGEVDGHWHRTLTEARHVYADVPAKGITDKLPDWEEINLDQKFERLKLYVKEFFDAYPEFRDYVNVADSVTVETIRSQPATELDFFQYEDLWI